ncbi:2-keto-3-deoxy-galactonokinase [Mucilaginibacter hurinus]|uniref:2-keto-3-deoxy-galactonokinase n=1 Tax=Mucilaginibacter hurinus TaxID=2201324 RepID=A0A367GRD4_9SPHI|nr:2-dehydro-3-deoxygalactonokinase [Mucilaginibacter hurinus]RCH56027.1 2-keto-3-deoxy-galactonokinase [Mucilaginibacter hurinus]
MDNFLSCDWGTSSFRIRLIRADDIQVVAEVRTAQGVAATYKSWQQNGASDRQAFYTNVIQQQVKVLEKQLDTSLEGIPIALSGMASSSIGLIDLPYKPLPFKLDGSDLLIESLIGSNPTTIISGACTYSDAMRGEETKAIGCAALLPDTEYDNILLMPGTHAKHISISGGMATGISSYMTGEFFELLAEKSVLAASVKSGSKLDEPMNWTSFMNGVKIGSAENLLHTAFTVRTNQVLKQHTGEQNYFYLSGLLLGTELADVPKNVPVYLVSGEDHRALYQLACEVLDIRVAGTIDADIALIKGQHAVLRNLSVN